MSQKVSTDTVLALGIMTVTLAGFGVGLLGVTIEEIGDLKKITIDAPKFAVFSLIWLLGVTALVECFKR